MARGREGDESESGTGSVLGLAGIGEGGKGGRPAVSRRALLLGVPAVSVTAAVVLGVVAEQSENARHRRALNPPVNPGPATARAAGTLAGPSAKPTWSVVLERSAHAVAVAAGTVVLVDTYGAVRGFDPKTGAAKWQPSVEFFVNDDSPLTVVGGTVYGSDDDGHFMAVDASNGALSWQTQFASSGAQIATVAGTAGPNVFSTGEIDDQSGGNGHGVLWCVDTTTRGTAWNINNVDYSLAVVASEPAGVVVTADEITYKLTAYSLKDQSVQWRKEAGNAEAVGIPASPAACVAVAGKTFYWAADKLYALDAASGDVRWTGSAPNPGSEFQSVIVVPGQGSDGADLIVAAATSPSGGTLHAFAADTGAAQWVEHGGPKFGSKTALTAGAGVVFAAERDNGSVIAVDAKSGQTRWTYHDPTISADLTWSVAADDTRVYVAYGEHLLAFEP